MTDDHFPERWQELVRAARQAPAAADTPVDVARILAARRRHPARLRIGWLPPTLAAAALIACAIGWAAGLELSPMPAEAGSFLVHLPQQVPRAPHLPAPDLPPATVLVAQLTPHFLTFSSFSALRNFPETSP